MSAQTNPQQQLRNGEHNTATNGANTARFDANLTGQVIAATGPKAHARLASILPNLTKHLHDFMRESEITSQELMAAFDLVGFGQLSRKRGRDLTFSI